MIGQKSVYQKPLKENHIFFLISLTFRHVIQHFQNAGLVCLLIGPYINVVYILHHSRDVRSHALILLQLTKAFHPFLGIVTSSLAGLSRGSSTILSKQVIVLPT